ncbi:GTPase HflX [Terracidiphilus sp.]|uniref:GTPase HflX n=1 Tax=Terracidiphilus sp. TaxID=1964191 RepID=UPI003C1C6C2D
MAVSKNRIALGSTRAERAILVGVDFTRRSRIKRAGADGARAAVRLNESADATADSTPSSEISALGLDAEESLAEFRELVLSAGGEIVAELIQSRAKPDPATLIGSGKVEEIAGIAASTEADLVLFDHDLTPTQLRNLDSALPCRVLDRTQLILDIFARHARTSEGQLQVELAQLEYMLPRLTGRGKAMSQLGGGIGTRGPGETQLEMDRRRIQRRIDHLKLDIEDVRRVRRQQRQRREAVPVPTVALVGYTNAGKSTLFNRLTGAHVLSSSRMFATLDPKVRAIELPSRRKVLLSDTVGFIRNLPHTLVTSFRATLEEVQEAEVLLHVRDAASTYGEEQKAQVEKVLGELDSLQKPRIEVLNKIDLLDAQARDALSNRLASQSAVHAVTASAQTGEGSDALLAAIDEALHSDPLVDAEFRIPQNEGAVLAAIEAGTVIHARRYEGNLVYLTVTGPASLVGRFRAFRQREIVD